MDQKQMDGGGPHVSLDSTLPTYFGFVRRGGDGKEVQFIEGPTRSATHVMGVFDDMTTLSLDLKSAGSLEPLAPGAALLRGFALPLAAALAETVRGVSAAAPFRHMLTPGGSRMSVAMTNCGDYGWVSDEGGYRYSPTDPGSGAPWPPLPEVLVDLAARAAAAAGFEDFVPDACLVNRYSPGSRLTLHQDKDERDPRHPIVSVSLGVPAVFLFGG